MFKFRKKREKGHEYNLTYDNLAVPEIHTHEPEDAADEDENYLLQSDNLEIVGNIHGQQI